MDTQRYYYLISHHNTIVYVDLASQCLRHAPLGTAPLNLLLEIDGERARLVMKDERSGDLRQLSIEHSSGKISEHMGDVELDCSVETFDGGTVALRFREQCVSADSDGRVRNDRDHCREWERYLPLTIDTIDTLLLLQRYSWLSHSDRRILSLGDETINLRSGFSFGPTQVTFAARRSCFVVEVDRDNDIVPMRIHIVDRAGTMNTFSLFRPLVYFCLYGDDSFYECLNLSLTSLTRFGGFTGAVGVACDRTKDSLLKYIPKAFHDRLIVSEASRDRGWFNQYYLDHELYKTYQPILYCDADVVFDANMTDALIDIVLRRRICCATEDREYPQLVECPVRRWEDGAGNYFGRLLYAADPNFADTRVALGNAGAVGFNNTALVRAVNDLVIMIASRQDPERLRTHTDQAILNYVLHKSDLGDFEILNRYCRLTRTVDEVPPAKRRGIVHFYLASGKSDAFEKTFAMRSYLDGLLQHVGENQNGGGDVDIALSIPGQMEAAELDRLARLASSVPPKGCIVEVGSRLSVQGSHLPEFQFPMQMSILDNLGLEHEFQYIKGKGFADSTSLCRLMSSFGSDKGGPSHNYTVVYDWLLSRFRDAPLNIFELGLGTNKVGAPSSMGADGKPGASLRGWREYFPRANIFGADIDRDILFDEGRIRTFWVDQRDSTAIRALWATLADIAFDIMIDDGLHEGSANIRFFMESFGKLKPGGIYVIEDVTPHDADLMDSFARCVVHAGKGVIHQSLDHPINKVDNRLVIFQKT